MNEEIIRLRTALSLALAMTETVCGIAEAAIQNQVPAGSDYDQQIQEVRFSVRCARELYTPEPLSTAQHVPVMGEMRGGHA